MLPVSRPTAVDGIDDPTVPCGCGAGYAMLPVAFCGAPDCGIDEPTLPCGTGAG